MEPLLKTNIERFSLKKYQCYQKHGLPVRLITGSGMEVHIIAQNIGVEKNQLLVESEIIYSKLNKVPRVEWLVINKRGTSIANAAYYSNVYIQTGAIDVKRGDVVLYGHHADELFYFMGVYDSISCLDGKGEPGFCIKWIMDLNGEQFCQAGTFYELDRSIDNFDFYMRKATGEEREQYWKFINDNGLRLDDGKLVCYPKIGQPYWSIEMENGRFIVVEHDAPKTQGERPTHKLCYSDKESAEQYAKEFNCRLTVL